MSKKVARALQLLMVTGGAFAFVGWLSYDEIPDATTAVWSALYKTLQTFIFETGFDQMPVPVVLQIAVYLAPLSLAGTLVYAVVTNAQEHITSLSFRVRRRRHVVIAGPLGFCLDFLYGYDPENSAPILFMLSPQARETAPEELLAHPVIFSDPNREQSWKRCAIANAVAAIVSPQSADQMEGIRRHVEKLRHGSSFMFTLHFSLNSVTEVRFFSRSKLFADTDLFYVEGFNVQHMAALQAVEQYAPHFVVPAALLAEQPPHLVIDGFNEYAKWLIVESAQLYHYPSLTKVHISLICDTADAVEEFMQYQPGIPDTVELNVVSRSEVFERLNSGSARVLPDSWPDPFAVFVVSEDVWDLPEQLRRWRRYLTLHHGGSSYDARIHVLLPSGLWNPQFYTEQLKAYDQLNFTVQSVSDFIHLKRFLDTEKLTDSLAEKIHEQYVVAYNDAPWPQLSDAQKEANRRSARHFRIKLNLAGYDLSDDLSLPKMEIPEFSAEQVRVFAQVEHQRWAAEKFLDGYVPGRPAADASAEAFNKKVLFMHKDIRPFEELSREDVSKDEETFRALAQLLDEVLEFKRLVTVDLNAGIGTAGQTATHAQRSDNAKK